MFGLRIFTNVITLQIVQYIKNNVEIFFLKKIIKKCLYTKYFPQLKKKHDHI